LRTVKKSGEQWMRPSQPSAVPISALFVFGILQLAALNLSCRAQGIASPAPARPAAECSASDTGSIDITAEVADKTGKPITGLQVTDFKLLDNKHPEKILSFQAVDADHPPAIPPKVRIILDAMNSNPLVVARERDGLSAFLKQNGGKLEYPTSIWMLGDDGLTQIAPASQDGTALFGALNSTQSFLRVINRSQGGWGDSERVGQALKLVREMVSPDSVTPGRKLVVFLSPGWPLLAFWEGADLGVLFRDIVAISNGLRQSCMTFYTLDPSSFGTANSFAYENYLKGAEKVSDAQYPDLSLQVLSEHSGGRVIIGGNDIQAEINNALRGAGTYYNLSFEAAAPHRGTQYHDIRLTVDKPHAKVHTTAGYYVVGP
jgi:VWFA-related protein